LLGISAFVSCNSYDVEGKPEIASNPAKMVFAYYPWDDGSSTDTEPTTEPTTEPEETPDTETPDTETPDTEEPDTENPDTEEPDTENPDTEEPDAENPDTEVPEEDSDTENPDEDSTAAVEEETPVYVVKAAPTDPIEQEFTIYNRGVTGELKIRKINLLDPEGRLIDSLGDETYKKLFQIQVQNVNEKGIVTEGFGEKGLTFDYMKQENKGKAIASLCPRKDDGTCKEGFDEKKYNSEFKILLTYDKTAATTLKDHPVEGYKQSGEFSIEICTNDPGKGPSGTCEDSTSYKIQVTRQPNKPPKPIIHVAFRSAITKPMSYRNIKDYVEMDLSKTCVSDPDAPDKCLPGCDDQNKNIWTGAECTADEQKNNWKQRYYIKYKWEMTESPTPLLDESKLQLESSGSAGQWLPDDGKRDRPVRAKFKGLMITPRRYPGEDNKNKDYNAEKCAACGDEPVFDPANPDDYLFLKLSDYLICRQKYCEEQRTKYYKINIQAETVDKETDLTSDTADITVLPKIIPQARVVAQLSYKQGYRTKAEMEASKDGATVDLDIHMVKKTSIEAADRFNLKEGLLGTAQRPEYLDNTCPVTMEECEKYWRHDDCSFADQGLENVNEGRTIQWHASLDIDNTWGGNNYDTPETIGLGPIEDELDNATGQKTEDSDKDGRPDGDGIPDVHVEDDQYLIVVGYVTCTSNYSDDETYADEHGYDKETFLGRCDERYDGEDGVYEVDARVDILIDGDEAPRKKGVDRPADSYADTLKDFKIKFNEWKVLAVVKWDGTLASPESNTSYPGNAIVTDQAMADESITIDPVNHPLCTYENSDAVLVPIWDAETYRSFISDPSIDTDGDDKLDKAIGTCN
jgi:hypothetical protein